MESTKRSRDGGNDIDLSWTPGEPPPTGSTAQTSRLAEVHHAALRLFAAHGYHGTTMAMIAGAIGIRAPSLYKHVLSKQVLLRDLMLATMKQLIRDHDAAVSTVTDPIEKLRRAVEAHVRYHTRNRLEAFVGNSEIRSLEGENKRNLLALRALYESRFRELIKDAEKQDRCEVESAKITSFAILDLGIGVATWYRDGGELTEDQIVHQYGAMVLKLVSASQAP